MLQRIQTIYLLLIVIALSLTFLFPFSSYMLDGETITFNIMGMEFLKENRVRFPFYVAIPLSMILTLVTIFNYKNRKLQLKLGRFNYLLLLLVIVLSFVNVRTLTDVFPSEPSVEYGVGLFMPVASLAFLFLANRGIKKDEDLIKSLDRLR